MKSLERFKELEETEKVRKKEIEEMSLVKEKKRKQEEKQLWDAFYASACEFSGQKLKGYNLYFEFDKKNHKAILFINQTRYLNFFINWNYHICSCEYQCDCKASEWASLNTKKCIGDYRESFYFPCSSLESLQKGEFGDGMFKTLKEYQSDKDWNKI